MTRRPALVTLAALTAACANLTETEGGVGSLTLAIPSPAEVEVGQTIRVGAVARNGAGDSVDIPVVWSALDTTLAADSAVGLITGLYPGPGRVVARAVDFYSPIVTFTVLQRVDTVIRVAPELQTVPITDSLSGELTVQLEGGSPLAPVSGRRVLYQIVAPVFADTSARTVEFRSGGLVATVLTASGGTPSPAPQLRRIAGRTAPDSAIVTANVYRPAGGPAVPGSGLQFVVRFANP